MQPTERLRPSAIVDRGASGIRRGEQRSGCVQHRCRRQFRVRRVRRCLQQARRQSQELTVAAGVLVKAESAASDSRRTFRVALGVLLSASMQRWRPSKADRSAWGVGAGTQQRRHNLSVVQSSARCICVGGSPADARRRMLSVEASVFISKQSSRRQRYSRGGEISIRHVGRRREVSRREASR